MTQIGILSESDVAELALSDAEVLSAVEAGLTAQSQGLARTEPTTSFRPIPRADGLVSVIRGTSDAEGRVLIKTVGTFPDNARRGLPPNPGMALLLESGTGVVQGMVAAAALTTLRTAAVTAIGAKVLARPDSRTLACIGTRGIAYQAVRYVAGLFRLETINIHSPNPESRDRAARDLTGQLGLPVIACDSWETCLTGADIMIEGASLRRNEDRFPADTILPGTTLIAYGAYSSMPADIMTRLDRIVVDRWVDDHGGAFGPQMAAGQFPADRVDALLGAAIDGKATVRTSRDDRILFWHRGVAACDIALASLLLQRAKAKGLGASLTL